MVEDPPPPSTRGYLGVLELTLCEEQLKKFNCSILLRVAEDAEARRVVKGFLLSRGHVMVCECEDVQLLVVLAYSATPPLSAAEILTSCCIQVVVEHAKRISIDELDPQLLAIAIRNYICHRLLQSKGFLAFAVDGKDEGVVRRREGESDSSAWYVFDIEELAISSWTAHVTVYCYCYKIKPLEPVSFPHAAMLLPLHREVKVLGPALGHLTSRDISNRAHGYSAYLPHSDAQCREYYRRLYGQRLTTAETQALVEVEGEHGLRSVVPTALLARLCTELPLQSKRLPQSTLDTFVVALQDTSCTPASVILGVRRVENKKRGATARSSFSSAKSLAKKQRNVNNAPAHRDLIDEDDLLFGKATVEPVNEPPASKEHQQASIIHRRVVSSFSLFGDAEEEQEQLTGAQLSEGHGYPSRVSEASRGGRSITSDGGHYTTTNRQFHSNNNHGPTTTTTMKPRGAAGRTTKKSTR